MVGDWLSGFGGPVGLRIVRHLPESLEAVSLPASGVSAEGSSLRRGVAISIILSSCCLALTRKRGLLCMYEDRNANLYTKQGD